MHINSLRVFLAVHETGSVSAASRKLSISQSRASVTIGRLRDKFGFDLFVRTRRGMEVTARAGEIVALARTIVDAEDRLYASKHAFSPAECTDEFTLVVSEMLEPTIIVHLGRTFRDIAPKARLASVSMRPDEIEEALATGQIAACIGSLGDVGSGIRQATAAKFTFDCYCSLSHPLAGRKASQAEFSGAAYAMLDKDGSLLNPIEEWFKQQRIERNVVVRTPHFQAIPQLVLENNLIAIAPSCKKFFGRDVGRIGLPFELPSLDLNVYWHQIFHDDPKNLWFRHVVKQVVKTMAANSAMATATPVP